MNTQRGKWLHSRAWQLLSELGAATYTQHTQPLQHHCGNCRAGQQGWLQKPYQSECCSVLILPTRGHASPRHPPLYWDHSQAPAGHHSPASSELFPMTHWGQDCLLWCTLLHGSAASGCCAWFDTWQNSKGKSLFCSWLRSCHLCDIWGEASVCNHLQFPTGTGREHSFLMFHLGLLWNEESFSLRWFLFFCFNESFQEISILLCDLKSGCES